MKNVHYLYNHHKPAGRKRVRRYAVCGLSQRAVAQYVRHLLPKSKAFPEFGAMSDCGRLVGILDTDAERMGVFCEATGISIPCYSGEEFDRMLAETSPEILIVTTPDHLHAEYIVRGLRAGCDIICEKPMVIDSAQAAQVLEAERASGRRVRVGFNYRYTQTHIRIKEMILAGLLGRITNIELAWNIDTLHGSTYFYRWNRYRELSGGLSVHKCCHHFDLVNWWVGSRPETVFAFGSLNYFGPRSPFKPPRSGGGVLGQIAKCPYHNRWHGEGAAAPEDDHLNPRQRIVRLPYHGQYGKGNARYIYDSDIEIEDTYSAVVRYGCGASLAYSANFSAPWEGYRLAINGTGGRLEVDHVAAKSRCPFPPPEHEQIRYTPLFGELQTHEIRRAEGGHGGADPLINQDLFREPGDLSRRIGLAATAVDGALAVAVGEAVWKSVRDGQPLQIADLIRLPAPRGHGTGCSRR
jgi:predicted dehydrogenase